MNVFKKSLIAAVASGLVLSGAAGAPVLAQDGQQVTTQQVNDLRNFNGQVTLNIHKHAGPAGDARDNGLEKDVNNAALEGAEFTVERVNLNGEPVDLTSIQGWRDAEKIQKDPSLQGVTFTKVDTLDSNAQGLATGKFPIGLYRVTESKAPNGYVGSAPFYVTLPMTHPVERNSWLNEVHVYPKNNPQEASAKTVKDANKNQGDTITYTLEGGVTRYDQRNINSYVLTDYYPSARLAPEGANHGVTKVYLADANGAELETLEAADYTVTNAAAGTAGTSLTRITLTPAGVTKLNANKNATQVRASVNFKVSDLPNTANPADSVVNKINVTQNPAKNPPEPGKPNEPGNPPEDPQTPPNDPPEDAPKAVSYWGNLEVLKQKAGTNENLKDAEFSVYRCSSETANDPEKPNPGPFKLEEKAIQSGTTGEDGKVFFTGLHANNFQDGKAEPSNPSGYCLVETKAPDGTQLQPRPIYFEVLAVGGNLAEGTGTVPAITLTGNNTVVNSPDNAGFQLPLTGGNGVWLLLIIGGALVLVGGGYAYYLRREGAVA